MEWLDEEGNNTKSLSSKEKANVGGERMGEKL
jgi:hypothetical protein